MPLCADAFAAPPASLPARSPEQRLDRLFLEKWRWSHLIMDEAHALKNRNASRTTRLRRIANASRRRIMMTGACRPPVVCWRSRLRGSSSWVCCELRNCVLNPSISSCLRRLIALYSVHTVLQAHRCRMVRVDTRGGKPSHLLHALIRQ